MLVTQERCHQHQQDFCLYRSQGGITWPYGAVDWKLYIRNLRFNMTELQLKQAGGEGSLTRAQCPDACEVRCSKTHHRGNCLDACNSCCLACLCVPSGVVGHKDECPCYRDRKTHDGQPKCP